jgi:molecular chaperone HtpG
MQFLEVQKSPYYGKVFELREAISGWLSYIPATFPHYTRHTIEHSEEIISQISSILFIGGDHQRPVLRELSSLEAYILIASAYLHDAGMTVSDDEKKSILQSSDWREWIEEGSGAARFNEIRAFRGSKSGTLNDTTRTFLADVQLRFLIAEFIRRTHHLRGGDILTLHQAEMGRFGYDDPKLIRAIASVCVAHGLRQNELNDPVRFPDVSTIRNERVNVRLLAVLLRLGDLLDMSTDRACPLLLNAASPLPAGSMAHWTQYNCISLISVEHDKILLNAECKNQEEHRFLHDWCAWLVSELDQAQRLMARSRRHVGWLPPVATIDQTGSTINIQPAPGANYIPAQWRFEVDNEAVFDRLVYDALDTPWDFLRELIQNSADASRCRMFAEVKEQSGSKPLYPTQVAEEIREMYPIQITLGAIQVKNELSEEMEERQLLTIEDEGLGMDSDVIQKYLLQVGRSYYTTRNFRENFGFIASSRFGVGFLSVFGVSNDITIETYKPSSNANATPLKLRLTGPKSYLLTEKGTRRRPGTNIQIVLRDTIEKGAMTDLVRNWCVRLEFPVIINDLGLASTIIAERAEDFEEAIPVVSEKDANLVLRSFPVNREGLEGSLFVLAYVNSQTERWDLSDTVNYRNSTRLQGERISLPEDCLLFHGINTASEDEQVTSHKERDPFRMRIDLRGERFVPSLSRNKARFDDNIPEISSRWEEILRNHFSVIKNLDETPIWKYKQNLSEYVGSGKFWENESGMIPITENGIFNTVSESSISNIASLRVYVDINFSLYPLFQEKKKKEPKKPLPIVEGFIIRGSDVPYLSNDSALGVFNNRILSSIELTNDFIICTWTHTQIDVSSFHRGRHIASIDFDKNFAVSHINSSIGHYNSPHLAINSSHPFGEWHSRVVEACQNKQFGLSNKLLDNLNSAIRLFAIRNDYTEDGLGQKLVEWSELPGLPENLLPPFVKVTPQNFAIIGFSR